jgi:nitrite reductase (NO-forming)
VDHPSPSRSRSSSPTRSSDPPRVEIPADRPISLRLRNIGGLEHDWSVDALTFSPNVRAGQEAVVELVAPTGIYEVYCSLPGHREAGMVGILARGDARLPASLTSAEVFFRLLVNN